MGRIQLMKSVIHSMLIYTIIVYDWPIYLLRDLDIWIINFIWSGDVCQRKVVTVAWKKVCKPYSEGGLGIKSLQSLNEASNLEVCWEFFHSQDKWAQVLRSRVMRNGSHFFIKSEFNSY
jgi:hypothetical protein